MTPYAAKRKPWAPVPPSNPSPLSCSLYATDAHLLHLFWSFLPEAADGIERAGGFVRAHTVGAGDAVQIN